METPGSESPNTVSRRIRSYQADLSTPIIYFVLYKILPIPRDQRYAFESGGWRMGFWLALSRTHRAENWTVPIRRGGARLHCRNQLYRISYSVSQLIT